MLHQKCHVRTLDEREGPRPVGSTPRRVCFVLRHVSMGTIEAILALRANKKLWPTTMRLPGGTRDQNISAVQVPVLALMRRRLLEHPIVKHAESLVA